ncbi:sodium:solute symporter family protein [candidate division KSB1 bacterium]|nr:sodium:solute symporter family protein [candidate division KSB1 bacterium]
MLGLPWIDITTILLYFVAVIVIGIYASRRITNQEDYFLGGRRFGKFVQTFAAFGQGTSAESAVGTTVLVARNGMAGIWQNLTSVLGLPIYWITSIWYRRMRLLTLGDFFEDRFNSRGLAALYALISSGFFMLVIGLGFTAMAKTITGITAKPVSALSFEERAVYDRALELEKLENTDSALLTEAEKAQLDRLRIENPRKEFSHIDEKILIWIVAVIVMIYAVMGGLEAAFLTDTLQGIFILILSLFLLPFAAVKINMLTGGSGLQGLVDAARSQLPQVSFEIWGSPALVDFTWYYIIAILIMNQINVAVQANQLTACGSAKDEYTARFGFTTGIYIKRISTLLWGISAFLLVILYSGVVKNPDYLWGHASRDLLGSAGMGLVGLMIACLMSALMSTADALMLTAASLMTHNFFRPLFPRLSERGYVWAGRVFGFLVILGGVAFASWFDNVFQMLKMLWEFNIIMAAAFWLGIKWRGATRIGAWYSMVSALIFFGILQMTVPLIPGVKTHPYLAKTVESIHVERTYRARQIDVEQRGEDIVRWDCLHEAGIVRGERPLPLKVGEFFSKSYDTPKNSIFWNQGLKYDADGNLYGSGLLSLELVVVDLLGFDLSKNPHALNETIRVIIRLSMPFLVLIIVSLLSQPDDKKRLDRFFVKMKTPALADRQADAQEMALSYAQPNRFDYKKMFPNSSWEFEKFEKTDILGMIVFTIGGLVILAVLYGLAQLGVGGV